MIERQDEKITAVYIGSIVSDNEVIRCQTDIVLTLFLFFSRSCWIFNELFGRQNEY